jgi:hypothetical protein
VSLEEQAAGVVNRAGGVRNPFVQHHVPKKTTAAAVQTAVQTTKALVDSLSGGAGTGAPAGGSTTPAGTATPAPSTPAPSTTSPKKDTKNAQDTYRVTLKFGEAGAEKTYKDVARLTPLPSSTNPFFVFLGLSDDGKSAVFLVDANAVPSGDGTCQPSADSCEQVVLKKGDVELFDLQTGTAGVVQYQLELTSIAKAKAATTASAAKAHARESRAGREYLRQVVAENPEALAGWDFSSTLGLLVAKQAPAISDVANLPQDVAAAAAGAQPADGTAVLTVPTDPQG